MSSLAPRSPQAIGVFDSGLGGLTVLRELRRALPHQAFIYLGDTARTPYGSKGAATIVRYAKECAQFLLHHQVKLLVVACNTASSFALEALRVSCPCPVIGTIDPAVQLALRESKSKRIAIIGTEATIGSGVYQRALEARDREVKSFAVACPLFVPLVEQGMFDGEIVEKIIDLYLKDLRTANVDSLILGCTHYPLLRRPIEHYLGPEVKVIECSHAIANEVTNILPESPVYSETSRSKFYVTDEVSRFNHLAKACLERETIDAIRVEDLSVP